MQQPLHQEPLQSSVGTPTAKASSILNIVGSRAPTKIEPIAREPEMSQTVRSAPATNEKKNPPHAEANQTGKTLDEPPERTSAERHEENQKRLKGNEPQKQNTQQPEPREVSSKGASAIKNKSAPESHVTTGKSADSEPGRMSGSVPIRGPASLLKASPTRPPLSSGPLALETKNRYSELRAEERTHSPRKFNRLSTRHFKHAPLQTRYAGSFENRRVWADFHQPSKQGLLLQAAYPGKSPMNASRLKTNDPKVMQKRFKKKLLNAKARVKARDDKDIPALALAETKFEHEPSL
jgi:hypothetical protein